MRIRIKAESSPVKVVIVCADTTLLEMFEVLIRDSLQGTTVVSFSKSTEAWGELSRSEPSLLITTDRMLDLTGEEICRRLLEQVKYPILVLSSWPKTEEWVKELAGKGLKVSLVPLPFEITNFQNILQTALPTRRTAISKRQIMPLIILAAWMFSAVENAVESGRAQQVGLGRAVLEGCTTPASIIVLPALLIWLWVARDKQRRRNPNDPRAIMADGARLEVKGDVTGAFAKYQEVVRRFAETEAANDAQASIRDLKTKIGLKK